MGNGSYGSYGNHDKGPLIALKYLKDVTGNGTVGANCQTNSTRRLYNIQQEYQMQYIVLIILDMLQD